MITGFADTITLFKKVLLERKGSGMFTLSTLIRDFLQNDTSEKCHNAKYDVEVSEKLVHCIATEKQLFENIKTFHECVLQNKETDKIAALQHVTELKEVISKQMLKRLAKEDITFNVYCKNVSELEEIPK